MDLCHRSYQMHCDKFEEMFLLSKGILSYPEEKNTHTKKSTCCVSGGRPLPCILWSYLTVAAGVWDASVG